MRDDFPVRLTASEARALLKAAAEALEGPNAPAGPRTRGALESAQTAVGNALVEQERLIEKATQAGKIS